MSMYMPGATAVGVTFDDGVVFASEKRIAYGNFLVSKTTKKTFPITPVNLRWLTIFFFLKIENIFNAYKIFN